jgi:hypothetical protein
MQWVAAIAVLKKKREMMQPEHHYAKCAGHG